MKWFVLQENSTKSSPIKAGPFFDESSALTACQEAAQSSPGVAFSVVKVVIGFSTGDAPMIKLKFTPDPGGTPT